MEKSFFEVAVDSKQVSVRADGFALCKILMVFLTPSKEDVFVFIYRWWIDMIAFRRYLFCWMVFLTTRCTSSDEAETLAWKEPHHTT